MREADDRTSLALALVENIVRADLDPVEQARGYARLQDEFGLSHAEVADAVGRSRVAVANATRLLGLPDEVLELLERGELSEGHGRALLQIEGQEERRTAARAVVAGGLCVRADRGARAHARPRRAAPGAASARAGSMPTSQTTRSTGSTATLGVAARVSPDRSGCRVELRLRSAAQLAEPRGAPGCARRRGRGASSGAAGAGPRLPWYPRAAVRAISSVG